jgi:hypothetical protein
MNAKTKSNTNETCETIKLGIDAHAKWYYVGRQVDGATPQPVQKMTFEGLLHFEVLRREVGDWSRFTNYPEQGSGSAARLRRCRCRLRGMAVATGVQLHRALPERAQQWRQTTRRQRQQEGQPTSQSHARGDGLADDALAARLPRAEEMDGRAGRSRADSRLRRGRPKMFTWERRTLVRRTQLITLHPSL